MYYSSVIQAILDGQKRVRTTCLGELVKSSSIEANVSTWAATLGDHLILMPISKTATLIFIYFVSAQSATNLKLKINTYGRNDDGEFEKIAEISPDISGAAANAIKAHRFIPLTLFELSKNENNFKKYANRSNWYLGFECIQAQTISPPSTMNIQVETFEGTPSTMPLEGDVV